MGFAMPLDERRARWREAMAGVQKDNIHAWRQSFLGALRQAGGDTMVAKAAS
jgi:trehalose-6-phosphate synthase